MKDKIDFILNEENGERLIFRFFPKKSNVEFADGYDKDWSNIWDIDYVWSIIKQEKRNVRYNSKTIYHHPYDKSNLNYLPEAINEIVEDKKRIYLPCDDVFIGGADWILTYNEENNNIEFKIYEHNLLGDGGKKYYLFSLATNKAKEFGSYIDHTFLYLIDNSELNYFGKSLNY